MKFTLSEMEMISEAVKLAIRSEKRTTENVVDIQIGLFNTRKGFKSEKEFLEHRNRLVEEKLANEKRYNSLLALSKKIDNFQVNIGVE